MTNAKADIESMKAAGDAGDRMQNWLSEKGINIDASSDFGAEQLQALMLYWHTTPERDRAQLKAANPTFSIATGTKRAGGHSIFLNAEGDATAIIIYKSISSAHADPIPEPDSDAFQQQLTLEKYDGGYAAILARRSAGDLVTRPGAPSGTSTLAYLYDAYTIAHEMTHLRQSHMDSMFVARKASGRDFEMLRYLVANKVNDVQIMDPTPSEGGIKMSPFARPLNHTARLQDRLAFTLQPGRDLEPSSRAPQDVRDAHARLRKDLKCSPIPASHEAFGDPNSPIKEDAYSETQDVLRRTFDHFKETIHGVIDPTTTPLPLYAKVFRDRLVALGKFLPRNAAPIADLASTASIPDVLSQDYEPGRNLREDYDALIDANKKLSSAEKTQLKAELGSIVDCGFQTIRSCVQTFELQTECSIQFAKQATQRFPGLLGKLTAYSNKFYKQAVEDTKLTFWDLVEKDTGAFTAESAGAPAAARAKITEVQAKWAATVPEIKYNTKAARDLIPDGDWFEIGVPLGLFNNYVAEYDAESSAIAANSPSELVAMFTRNMPGITDALRQEVLNHATYVLSRGIEEVIAPGEAVIDYAEPVPEI